LIIISAGKLYLSVLILLMCANYKITTNIYLF